MNESINEKMSELSDPELAMTSQSAGRALVYTLFLRDSPSSCGPSRKTVYTVQWVALHCPMPGSEACRSMDIGEFTGTLQSHKQNEACHLHSNACIPSLSHPFDKCGPSLLI